MRFIEFSPGMIRSSKLGWLEFFVPRVGRTWTLFRALISCSLLARLRSPS